MAQGRTTDPRGGAPAGDGRPLSVALNGWFWGEGGTGSGQYLMHLLQHLLRRPTHDVYTLFVPAGRQPAVPAWASGRRLRIVTLRTPFDRVHADLAKVWFEQVAFPAACRRCGADVAHVPYWGSPAKSPLPLLVTIHDLIPLILPAYAGSRLVRLYTRLVSTTARRAQIVLTDSRASAEDIAGHLGIPAGRTRVIPLAAGDGYAPVPDGEALEGVRRRYGLPATYILYLGGFDERKNVPRLIEAYAGLLAERPDAPALVVAGRLPESGGRLFCDPQAEVRARGIDSHVYFPGFVAEADKPALYAGAICFVFPSLYEGFGLPVLEAMACGTPAITSGTSSLPEIAGDAGMLVDPRSTDAIRSALGAMLNPETRRRYAAAALAGARQFAWHETARLTWEAYHAAATECGAPGARL